MGQKAARIGDSAGHGGLLLTGSFKVLIGNMPAARLGDPLICPGFDGPKAHVMGNIMKASTTVMIDGAFAARMGDDTACGAVGVSGAGAPAVAGPATPVEGSYNKEKTMSGSGQAGFGYTQESGHTNDTGFNRTGKFSGQHETYTREDGQGNKITANYDAGTVTAEGYGGIGAGGVGAQGSVVKGDVTVSNAAGDSTGVQGGLFNGQIGAGALIGTDGRRTGIGASASAQVSVAEGQVDSTTVYNIPFTDYTIRTVDTLGGSVGSLGAAASAGIYHDALDDRFHINGMLDAKVTAGLKIGMDISFGKKAGPGGGGGGAGGGTPGVPVPLTPGKILIGCANVEIG